MYFKCSFIEFKIDPMHPKMTILATQIYKKLGLHYDVSENTIEVSGNAGFRKLLLRKS